MAEGFLRYMAGDKFKVFSTGVKPTTVNPLAIKVMVEVGVDISRHRSRSAMEFISQQFDYVITVCDNVNQTCPIFPGKYEKIHWDLKDPAEAQGSEAERIVVFRAMRDEIRQKIEEWIKNGGDSYGKKEYE